MIGRGDIRRWLGQCLEVKGQFSVPLRVILYARLKSGLLRTS